jgi:putative sigma-54 modulation protein
MKILQISGRNLEVTPALRDHVTAKLERLDRLGDGLEARVVMAVRESKESSRKHRVEIQVHVPGGMIRSEEHHADMYAAVDLAVDTLERQLHRFRSRYLHHHADHHPEPLPHQEDAPEDTQPEIVRTKSFALRPMTPEDAVLQMEALGHDFFVFVDASDQHTAVVYRRRDGNYGLITPRV